MNYYSESVITVLCFFFTTTVNEGIGMVISFFFEVV